MSKKAEMDQEQDKVTSERPKSESNVLKKDETLGQFATRRGVSLGKLRELNDLTANSKVVPGQKLVVK